MTASDASFTDEEYAFLRHVRFGELPPGARPDEREVGRELRRQA